MPNSECLVWPHSACPLFKQPLVSGHLPRSKEITITSWVSELHSLQWSQSLNTSSQTAKLKLPATHFWGSHLVLPWFLWDLYITAALMFHFPLHFYFLKKERMRKCLLCCIIMFTYLLRSMKKVFHQMEVNVKNVKNEQIWNLQIQLLQNQLKTFKIYELQTVYIFIASLQSVNCLLAKPVTFC